MTRPLPRKFGLTDAMILVAAFAIGFYVNKTSWPEVRFLVFAVYGALDAVLDAISLIMPHVAALTLAFLAIRSRRPRPSLRRLATQPGAVACAVAAVCLVVVGCWVGINVALGRSSLSVEVMISAGTGGRSVNVMGGYCPLVFAAYSDRIGFAVAGAWVTLLVGGRCRPEPEWIDRFGRALGLLWIVATIAIWLRAFLV